MTKIAAIRIRGQIGIDAGVKRTLNMLGLSKKNTCVVLEMNDEVKGMIKKIQDQITWGEISEDILKSLDEKRGKSAIKKEKTTVYFLAPPRKGFRKGGIKKSYTQGGVLGYRSEKINDLLERMI